MQILTFAEPHLDGLVNLCAAEGWPSWAGERALGAFTAPGVIGLVAVEGERVVGAAQLLTDSHVIGYLGLLVVAADHRGQGVGGALVAELFARSGLQRLDLLSTEEALPFYEARPHRRKPGVRLYG